MFARRIPGEQHVVGLDVAVNDAVRVGVAQRVGHVAQDPHGLGHRQLAVAPEPRAERLAFDERHGVVEQVARLAGGEQRDDVRMLERRGQLDLAAEPVQAHAGREFRRQHLDHDLPAELRLLRHEHPAHGTAAELAAEHVAVGQRRAEAVERVGQGNARIGTCSRLLQRRGRLHVGHRHGEGDQPVQYVATGARYCS